MKIGDYVKIKNTLDLNRNGDERLVGKTGIIIDTIILDDGFPSFEVMLEDEIGWFDDIELEIVCSY